MASNDIAVVLDKLKADLTCPICQEVLKEPKSLPCLHSFCQGCLEKNVSLRILDDDEELDPPDARNILRCPVCKFRVELSPIAGVDDVANAVGNIRTNVCLKNLVDHYELGLQVVGRSKKSRCGFCDDVDNEAVAFCQSRCNRLLCEVCLKAHKRMTLTSKHNILGLEAARSSTTSTSSSKRSDVPAVVLAYRARKCSKHYTEGEDEPNERMTDMMLYCYECKEVICCICAIAEHQPHARNTTKNVVAEPEHLPRIQAEIKEMERTRENLDDLSAKFHGRKFHIEDARSKTEAKIEAQFTRLTSELEGGKDTLLQTIDDIQILHMNNLRQHRKNLDDKRKAVEHVIKFIKRRQALSSYEDLVHLAKEMTLRASQLLEEAKIDPPVGAYRREIKFTPGDMDIAGVMGIVSAEPCIDIFTADDVKQLDFVRNKAVEFTVTARDVLQNEATTNDELVLAELQPVDRRDSQVIKASVKKLQNHKCLVVITPQETGPHTLQIRVAKSGKYEHIQDSPFDVVVAVNPIHNLYEI